MALHVFDMDNTLIENDCDVSWKEFLVAEKLAPQSALDEAQFFFDQYNRGCLDEEAFAEFQLREFAGHTPDEMRVWCKKHFEVIVRPAIRSKAKKYIDELKNAGHTCAIITSTNHYIAEPVAEFLGISELYGTPLELADGRFTGAMAGKSFVGRGKVMVLERLCAGLNISPSTVWAYGDSVNDIPMLEAAGRAFAVSPSAALQETAARKNWTILDWKLDKTAK
ncbi:MAG: HAD-IB family hydrolase [Lentisphaerae bacterium]|nr:HAD-IB family hydrolase [Lentisphaerota bacterium]